jgi:general secretion pathway protein K
MTLPSSKSRTEGMILIVVLWAISLMTLAVVAISALSHKSLSVAGAETERLRSTLALEAGLAAGNALILATPKDRRIFLDGSSIIIDVGNQRQAEIRVRDAAGLLDLNRADLEMTEAVLAGLAGDAGNIKSLVAAIRKLRPEQKEAVENQPGQQPGQQNQQPRTQPPPGQQPQPQGSDEAAQPAGEKDSAPIFPPVFVSTSELYGIEGVSQELVDKLLPFITLYSSTGGKVNPMAAPPEILKFIPGLGERERKILEDAQVRKQVQAPEVETVMSAMAKYLSITEPRTFIVQVRLAGGPGVITGSRLSASVVIDSSGKEAFQVLDWSW